MKIDPRKIATRLDSLSQSHPDLAENPDLWQAMWTGQLTPEASDQQIAEFLKESIESE